MKDELTRYVELLFAGAPHANDIKQEILQNTLDRYDDLIAQGKAPEAAYSLANSGIGDISEILASDQEPACTMAPSHSGTAQRFTPQFRNAPVWKKALRAAAVVLYILSIIPLIVLGELGMEIIGLCGTLAIVAIATGLIIIVGGKSGAKPKDDPQGTPQQELPNAVNTVVNTVCLIAYFVLSFATGAWYITWVIFPMMGAMRGLVKACLDLKEANKHEN